MQPTAWTASTPAASASATDWPRAGSGRRSAAASSTASCRPTGRCWTSGAGYCDFINNVRAARRIAVDLNPDAERRRGPRRRGPHHAAGAGSAQVVAAESVDLAFASNVFEHLRGPDALLEVLARPPKVLRPDGRLIVMQPNARLVGGSFWDFFDHPCP